MKFLNLIVGSTFSESVNMNGVLYTKDIDAISSITIQY